MNFASRWAMTPTATVLSLGLALSASAQKTPPSPQPQVFGESIDVRVVNVEAVVTGGGGERVRGLTAADFRLLVDGREVPVEYFAEVAEGAAVKASGAPVAAGEEVGRSYLIYVDDSFSLANRRDEVLNKLERDLTLLRSADRMAILAFDGERIEVLSGWTGDVKALAAALARARQSAAHGGRALAHQRALQGDVDWVDVSAASIDDGDTNPLTNSVGRILESMENRVSPEARTQLGKTAAAAAAALRGFEAPPGRKVMLLLSGAWPLSVAPRLYGPLLAAANRLGYTVYPVDASQSDAREITALDVLARATGGRAMVTAANDAFRQVVQDTGTYYWLGFTPSWKANDQGHRVTVEVRRPGLAVRSRGGFSDLSKRSENALKAESVLLFGGAAEERRLLVQLGAPRRRGRELEVPVTLGVPVEALALTPQGKGYLAEVPLAVAAMDDQGGRADLPGSRLKVTVAAPPRAGTYARFQTVVRLRNAGQRLVFTVPDPASGRSLWGEASLVPGK